MFIGNECENKNGEFCCLSITKVSAKQNARSSFAIISVRIILIADGKTKAHIRRLMIKIQNIKKYFSLMSALAAHRLSHGQLLGARCASIAMTSLGCVI